VRLGRARWSSRLFQTLVEQRQGITKIVGHDVEPAVHVRLTEVQVGVEAHLRQRDPVSNHYRGSRLGARATP
jgi:hypothetical protein